MSFRAAFKKFYDPAALPIVVIVTGAVVGASWYMTHLARGPEVVWDKKNNPEPWNNVKEGDQVKLYAVNQHGERPYKREKL